MFKSLNEKKDMTKSSYKMDSLFDLYARQWQIPKRERIL